MYVITHSGFELIVIVDITVNNDLIKLLSPDYVLLLFYFILRHTGLSHLPVEFPLCVDSQFIVKNKN